MPDPTIALLDALRSLQSQIGTLIAQVESCALADLIVARAEAAGVTVDEWLAAWQRDEDGLYAQPDPEAVARVRGVVLAEVEGS